jgi:hypothetical protein
LLHSTCLPLSFRVQTNEYPQALSEMETKLLKWSKPGSSRRKTKRFGKVAGLLSVAAFVVLAVPVKANTVTFHFAPVGTSFSASVAPDNPLIGKEVVSSRIYLNVGSFPGSDAANFVTDISFPISPFPGNENVLSFLDSDLGWSGAGEFHFFEQTTLFNGILLPLDLRARHRAKTLTGDYSAAPGSNSTSCQCEIGAVSQLIFALVRR